MILKRFFKALLNTRNYQGAKQPFDCCFAPLRKPPGFFSRILVDCGFYKTGLFCNNPAIANNP